MTSIEKQTPITDDRLDMKQAKLSTEQRQLQTESSIALERLDASLDLYASQYSDKDAIGKVSISGTRVYSATINVNLPLFGFGSTSGKIQALKAELASSKINEKARREQIIIEGREAIRRFDRAADRIQIADAALKLSEKSYGITEERYKNGLINSRELLDAQLDLTRTRKEALNARIECELARANLERIAP